MRWICSLSLLVFFLSPPAWSLPPWVGLGLRKGHPHSYYGVITGRDYDRVCEQIAIPKLHFSDGSPVPDFDFTGVSTGSTRLLSVGEGVSTFVFQILAHREALALDLSTVHAFDLFYAQDKPVDDDWDSNVFFEGLTASYWNEKFQKRDRLMRRFPKNYHGGYFQALSQNLLGLGLFDEIISSHSVSYLLGPSETKEVFANSSDEQLLLSVLSLLKKGGYLRIWPYANNVCVNGMPSRYQYLKRGLESLKNRGLIADHSMDLDTDPLGVELCEGLLRAFHYVVIRK